MSLSRRPISKSSTSRYCDWNHVSTSLGPLDIKRSIDVDECRHSVLRHGRSRKHKHICLKIASAFRRLTTFPLRRRTTLYAVWMRLICCRTWDMGTSGLYNMQVDSTSGFSSLLLLSVRMMKRTFLYHTSTPYDLRRSVSPSARFSYFPELDWLDKTLQ